MTHVIGLTGSMGAGKSLVASIFREQNIPVFDADAMVHQLMSAGGPAVAPIESTFFGVKSADGGIDREKLGKIVFHVPGELEKLENILHPMVSQLRDMFIEDYKKQQVRIVLLDIPLLFEVEAESCCNSVMVVVAGDDLERERALKRGSHSADRVDKIRAKQLPTSEKVSRADIVIDNGGDVSETREQVLNYLAGIRD